MPVWCGIIIFIDYKTRARSRLPRKHSVRPDSATVREGGGEQDLDDEEAGKGGAYADERAPRVGRRPPCVQVWVRRPANGEPPEPTGQSQYCYWEYT